MLQVKALNTKGTSENSQEIRERTRVDRIPVPHRVAYDRASHTLSINVPATCLPLTAIVETVINENHPITAWQVIDTLDLQVSGLVPTYKEKSLDQMGSRSDRAMGRSFDEPIAVNDDYNPRVRVKLCLQTHPEHCGEFVEAECKYSSLAE